jgi:copper chaperone CopZ
MIKGEDTMSSKHFTVPNISCGHCTMRIEKTLNALNGVTAVTAEIPTKAVTVEWDETTTDWEAITTALEKIGYPPAA